VSAPKPRIKPKGGSCGQERAAVPSRDAPPYPERDPPVFTERDPDMEQKADERVLFHEDDCLR
jgi:hypothetical protein